jgi:hypothetical protein
MLVLAVGYNAACSGGRSEQRPAQESAHHPRPSTVVASGLNTTPGDPAAPAVLQAGAADVPKFVAGTYDLVLDRDQPLFDDSLAARDYVERRLAWGPIDSARDWRDSVRLLAETFKGREGLPPGLWELLHAATAKDSAEVAQRVFGDMGCTQWRSGGSLTLESDGRIADEDEWRTYCRGKVPAYTRRTARSTEPHALGTCKSWEAPAPATVPHLTCQSGGSERETEYRYVGDTLTLYSDCGTKDTYVLRRPERLGVARSSDVSRLEEC